MKLLPCSSGQFHSRGRNALIAPGTFEKRLLHYERVLLGLATLWSRSEFNSRGPKNLFFLVFIPFFVEKFQLLLRIFVTCDCFSIYVGEE